MFFLFKQKTAYEMRISDWSSDVCSSDLPIEARRTIVGEQLVREFLADRLGEATGIGHVGLRGFPPQQIGLACEGAPALDAMIDPGAVLQAEEALGRALAREEFVIALVNVRGDRLGAFGCGAGAHQRSNTP